MVKKRLILGSVLLLAILLYVQAVSAGCCVDDRFGSCTAAFNAGDCADPMDYTIDNCDAVSRCDIVCCYDTAPPGSSDAAYRLGCNEVTSSRFTVFAELGHYEPSLGLFRDSCQTCTDDLTCADGTTIIAYCDIRPPETIGRYVPTLASCAVPIAADRDGDGEADATDVCPDEPAITTQAEGFAPRFASEVGYCRDFIDNDCDGLTDYADRIDCPAPCTADITVICPDRSRVTTHTCDVTTRELSSTGLACRAPEGTATGTCGDGIKQTPNAAFFNEQCDYGAASPDSACGLGGTCLGAGDPLACTCQYTCLDDPGRPFALVLTQRAATNELGWGVNVGIGCTLSWFDIYRCDGAADCDPLSGHVIARDSLPVEPYTYSDTITSALRDVNMCYQVVAHYTNGIEVASDAVCTGAAPEECSRFTAPFCNDARDAIITCTSAGTSEEPCAPSEFCRESTSTGPSGTTVSGAQCIAQSPCDQCNGFLGLFGFLDITLADMVPSMACSALPSCAYDYSKSIMDSYQMCSNPESPESSITSCYDYNSKDACEHDEDHCSVGREGCEWIDSPNAKAFGVGVCRPIDEMDQDCERCNAQNPVTDNTYFKGCTSDRNYLNSQNCRMYGFDRSLGWIGLPSCLLAPNPTPGVSGLLCQNARDLGCQSYGRDSGSCGLTPVDVDVIWDDPAAPTTRISGTNAITARSDDVFEYGTCRYDMAMGCFKDADDNGVPDCDPLDFACQKDNTVPQTIVTAADVPVRGGNLLLGRSVDLDVSLSEDATTFFCIDPPDIDPSSGESCYPDIETVCKLQRVLPVGTASGNGVLRYYSEDTAHNLEQVSEIDVELDMDAPRISFLAAFNDGDRSLDILLELLADGEVTCDGILTDVHQGVIHAGRGSASNNAIDGEIGRSFSRTYYSVDDGVYVYSYDCWDEAGNHARDEKLIRADMVDTNRIHPLAPEGITRDSGDKVLTVDTEGVANCKYDTRRENYDRLRYTFTTTDASVHTTAITGCSNCFEEYYISCVFADDGAEEGNNQDVLRWSVDLTPPRALAYNTLDADVEFNPSTVYGSTQNIFFQCKDDYFRETEGVIGFDYGCAELTAADSVTSITAAGDDMAGPFLVRGPDGAVTHVTITANPTDAGGNSPSAPLSIPVTIDRTPPPLEVKVYNALTGDGVVAGRDMLGPLEYNLNVRSRGLIHDVTAGITISHPVSGYTDSIVLSALSESSLTAEFAMILDTIPEEDVPYDITINVRGETEKAGAMCAPGAAAPVTYPGSMTLTFQLDTHLPEFTLEPLLDWDETGSAITLGTSDYPGYPVYYYADEFTYYTNQTSIFVTGFVNGMIRTPEMIFFAGSRIDSLSGTPASRVLLRNVASAALRDGLQPIITSGPQGADNLLFGRPIDASRHYQFDNEDTIPPGHYRTSYGNYMRMYTVDYLDRNTAYFEGELEADVLPSMTGFKYNHGDKPWPADWFGADIALSQGENWLSIVAKSDTGITSIPEYRRVIVDTNAPEVIESLPGPSDTSRAIYTISIVVRESKEGAPLLLESLGLDLNGTIIQSTDLVVITDESDPVFDEYSISYTSVTPLHGTYHIRWIGHDKAANTLRSGAGAPEYDFTVGDGLPNPPLWTIEGALEHDNIWYTANDRAPFTVEFNMDVSRVDVFDVFYKLYESESRAPTRSVCTSPAANVWRCTYEPPLVPNQAYHYVIEAQKMLTEGPGPIGVYTSPPVVIDNDAPIIRDVIYQDPIAEDVNLTFEMNIPNEQWPLQGELYFSGDGRPHPLTMIGNDRAGNYIFNWKVPNYASGLIPALERPNTIDITISDYAGNAAAPWHGSLTLDMTPPSLIGFTFDPDVPFRLADHYFTSSATLRISGEFTDSDIDAVIIEPGNFMGSDFAPAAYASIREDNTYEIILELEGAEDDTATTDYTYAVVDGAGNRVVRPFQVTVDMTPPDEPMIIIS